MDAPIMNSRTYMEISMAFMMFVMTGVIESLTVVKASSFNTAV